MSTEDAKKDFFISYNKADRAWAEWIAWELKDAGYTVHLQAWHFRPGQNFALEMDDAAKNALCTIAVLSPDYLTSEFTAPEWAAAFAQDPTGKKRLLIPVRVRDCKLEGLLAQIIYIDLAGITDEAECRRRLLDGVKPVGEPGTKPDFPGAPPHSGAKKPRFPGTLPPHWNVPHNRNPNFTGRVEILDSLHAALTSGAHAALTQAMAGLGGVGKTQLALEYAYRYADLYDIVCWIRSEDASTLASDYAALARELNLPEKDAAEQPKIVEAVRAHLGQRTGWLLIFDNVTQPADLDGYLPMGQGGNVIITSRYQAWGGRTARLAVEKWKREESVEFLLKRTGSKDTDAADALADALGDFPLALEQAAAYMDETGRPLPEYLKLFNEHAQELLRKGDPPVDYPATVATTWEISFQQVEKESPAGADLLNLCAFFAPDNIPLDVIAAGAEFLPEPLAEAVPDELKLDVALRALRRYSLIECADGMLTVHRLVQQVTRDRLNGADRKKWAEAAVRVVSKAFPGESWDVRIWDECARLLPHTLASADHAEDLGVAPDATGRALNEAGVYLEGRAQYADAKGAHERALIIGEAAFGPDHPSVAVWVNNLGGVLRDLGGLAGAKAHFERALRIGEKAFGMDHPQVATYTNNLGGVLRALGDLPGAKKHFERALAICERAFGKDHPTVAIRLNNLGGVLRDLGDLPGAKEHYERALKIGEATLGPDHPKVAIRLNNLGLVLKALGDQQAAKEQYERALAIFRRFLGEEHPTTKTVRENLDILRLEIEEKESGGGSGQ